MNFDWKKIGLWGGGITAIGVIGYWLYQYQQTAAANSAAQAAQDSQNQNQALAALMTESYTGGGSASVSGPTVDTGNNSLQALIASILNPPATAPATPNLPVQNPDPIVGTGSIPVSGSNPPPIIATTGGPVVPVNGPVGSSTLTGYSSMPDNQVSISPGRLYTMPVATSMTQ